jgi:hypothetical protein
MDQQFSVPIGVGTPRRLTLAEAIQQVDAVMGECKPGE